MELDEWKEGFKNYLAQRIGITDIFFDLDVVDPEILDWAVDETRKVYPDVEITFFRSSDGKPISPSEGSC